MSETIKGPAPRPCESCPYRLDVPSGIWAREEYEKLPRYDADTMSQPSGLFLCHQTGADDPHSRLCAGWVGCHGGDLIALRLAFIQGRITGDAFDYETDVPLHPTGRAAADHGLADVESPGRAAVSVGVKIARKRGLA